MQTTVLNPISTHQDLVSYVISLSALNIDLSNNHKPQRTLKHLLRTTFILITTSINHRSVNWAVDILQPERCHFSVDKTYLQWISWSPWNVYVEKLPKNWIAHQIQESNTWVYDLEWNIQTTIFCEYWVFHAAYSDFYYFLLSVVKGQRQGYKISKWSQCNRPLPFLRNLLIPCLDLKPF